MKLESVDTFFDHFDYLDAVQISPESFIELRVAADKNFCLLGVNHHRFVITLFEDFFIDYKNRSVHIGMSGYDISDPANDRRQIDFTIIVDLKKAGRILQKVNFQGERIEEGLAAIAQ